MKRIQLTKIVTGLTLATTLAVPTLLPATAQAQGGRYDRRDDQRQPTRYDRNDRRDDHRQTTKNEWRNLGTASGVLGIAGLLTGNRTLAALGLGGGAYSAYRYEQDRKSQNRFEHDRYELFRRPSFEYGGHRYDRHERSRNGRREFVFIRRR